MGEATLTLPRVLSIYHKNPHYNAEALARVDKVYVDGVLLPDCAYYNMDKGEAIGLDKKRNWLPKVFGKITVTEIGVSNKAASYGDKLQENALPPGAIDLFSAAGDYIGDEPFRPSDPADFL